jgi:hypothetical protein
MNALRDGLEAAAILCAGWEVKQAAAIADCIGERAVLCTVGGPAAPECVMAGVVWCASGPFARCMVAAISSIIIGAIVSAHNTPCPPPSVICSPAELGG